MKIFLRILIFLDLQKWMTGERIDHLFEIFAKQKLDGHALLELKVLQNTPTTPTFFLIFKVKRKRRKLNNRKEKINQNFKIKGSKK